MTDTTPALEAVTPEVEAILKDVTPTRSDPLASGHTALVKWLRNPWRKCDDVARGPIPEWTIGLMHEAATMLEALAADRDAQKARADALEKARDEDAKDYCALMERHDALIRRAEAAEAKVAKLVEVLTWTDMELAKLSGLWHDVSPRKQIRAAIAEAGQ